jgi:glycerol kinase
MSGDSGLSLADLRVDGGAAANDWLMQFQADVLGLSVTRPAVVESTAVGAARLAGLATGVWKVEDLAAARGSTVFRSGKCPEKGWEEWNRAVGATVLWARDAKRGI